MNKQLVVVELIGDLAFPLIGYFFWEWNFSFILLFFLMDLIARTGGVAFKLNQTKQYRLMTIFAFQLVLFFLLSGVILHLSYSETAIIEQISLFWNHKDMGIAQGWLLLPLLPLSEYMRFQNEKKMGITLETSLKLMENLKSRRWIQIGILGLLLGILTFVPLSEIVLLFAFLGLFLIPLLARKL